MDLVFVDGSHTLNYVRSDTANAFKMVVPDSGVVVWHDYGNEFPDVRNFLDEIAAENSKYEFSHMLHTLMVVAIPRDAKK